MEKILGDFSSWKIVSYDFAIKHCDQSVFRRHGSAVPKPTRWFWGLDGFDIGTRKPITLKFKDVLYQASINIYSNDLSQIYWDKSLGKVLELYCQSSVLPDMAFERCGDDVFEVFMLNVQGDATQCDSLVLDKRLEGRAIKYYTTKYERSRANRDAAIQIHGLTCMVCGFNFEEVYGDIGRDYIEVHHVKPLSSLDEEVEIDSQNDLVCLCSNCHRMIHRRCDSILSVSELKMLVKKQINSFYV